MPLYNKLILGSHSSVVFRVTITCAERLRDGGCEGVRQRDQNWKRDWRWDFQSPSTQNSFHCVYVVQSYWLAHSAAYNSWSAQNLHKICVFVACCCCFFRSFCFLLVADDDHDDFFSVLRFPRMAFDFTWIHCTMRWISIALSLCVFSPIDITTKVSHMCIWRSYFQLNSPILSVISGRMCVHVNCEYKLYAKVFLSSINDCHVLCETDNDVYKNGNFITYAILRSHGMQWCIITSTHARARNMNRYECTRTANIG